MTERKRVEEELLVQKAYLEELFQCAPEGIVVLNNEGSVAAREPRISADVRLRVRRSPRIVYRQPHRAG